MTCTRNWWKICDKNGRDNRRILCATVLLILLSTVLISVFNWREELKVRFVSNQYYFESKLLGDKLMLDSREAVEWLKSHGTSSLAVLIHACARPTIADLVKALISCRSSQESWTIIVIQHCWHKETVAALKEFGDKIHLIQGPKIILPEDYLETAYYHLIWALNFVFQNLHSSAAMVMKDNMDISPYFFNYFEVSALPLKNANPLSLWCVLGYNDDGEGFFFDLDTLFLYRTDFFSGIAWMSLNTTWKELSKYEWPMVYFYDWILHQQLS